jgi:hypothetical protein
MKKIIISLGLCLCAGFTAMAQSDTADQAFVNKRGISLLPKAGDFALGVDATPFLDYVGNFFSLSGGNSLSGFNGVNNTIYGKYFLEDDRAIRVGLRLNFFNRQNKGTKANDTEIANNPLNANATVVDVQNIMKRNVDLLVGYEFRRGRGRVQGFYGGEVGLGYGGGKTTYDYGNPMTELNQAPSTTDFGANVTAGNRVTETIRGTELRASVGGFVGVEYFFAPQMSVGGEFNLAFVYRTLGQDENTSESFDAASNRIQTIKSRSRNASERAGLAGVRTNTKGTIFLMFHF